MRLQRLILTTGLSALLGLPGQSWGQLGLTNYVFTFSYATHVGATDPGVSGRLSTVTPWLQAIDANSCPLGDSRVCITLQSFGPGPQFTTPLTNNTITSQAEQDAVFAVPANIKVVASIQYCGTFSSLGYRGCTQQASQIAGAANMIVTSVAPAGTYGHEFGHAQNASDRPGCAQYLMCSGCADPRKIVPAIDAGFIYQPNGSYSTGTPCAVPLPSVFHSYFVPQTGAGTEGSSAIASLRTCPNNDGGTSTPGGVRIKVVVRDDSDLPISGLGASDIYLLFNGGTSAQGFSGFGADSVIANTQWNSSPFCPDVRTVASNTGTDASGIAYITLLGASGRDSNRKWGHYDTKIPVYVNGVEIQGRLTSGGFNGEYELRIKNMDWAAGLGAVANQGEAITVTDYNGVANELGVNNAISYWKDFDNNGSVGAADLNLITNHLLHDCETPNSP